MSQNRINMFQFDNVDVLEQDFHIYFNINLFSVQWNLKWKKNTLEQKENGENLGLQLHDGTTTRQRL